MISFLLHFVIGNFIVGKVRYLILQPMGSTNLNFPIMERGNVSALKSTVGGPRA